MSDDRPRGTAGPGPDRPPLPGADGVRALACLWVFGHHVVLVLGLPHRGVGKLFGRHGPLGVVVFFVLSGFLLSRPWWAALASGGPPPSLRRYARHRAARLLPAWVVVLLASAVVFGTWTPRELVRLGAGLSLVSALHPVTYFPVPGNAPCWSVGVEAVFYAVLPCVGAALLRARTLAGAQAVVVVGLGGVLAGHAAVVASFPSPAPPPDPDALVALAHAWWPERSPLGLLPPFLLGVLAASAVARPAPPSRHGDAAAAVALALLGLDLAAGGRLGAPLHVPGLHGRFPAFPAAVALLLVGLARSRHLGRWLDALPLRGVARWSYGLYLVHGPVLLGVAAALVGTAGPAHAPHIVALVAGLGLAASLALAAASWRWVEAPVLRRARARVSA